MTAEVMSGRAAPRASGRTLLNAATTSWFFVTLVGQWVFLYYIAAFYGTPALSGDFAAWNTHPMVRHAFVPGDVVGNVVFGSHVAVAAIIALGGALQLIPVIRTHAPAVHRWNGRLFMVAAMLASLAGLYLVWIRQPNPDPSDLIISGNAALVLVFGVLAWRAGAVRNIASHRRWALRTFMVTNGVFWLRLSFSAYIVITQSQPSTLFFLISSVASYVLPWALLELYFVAKDRGGAASVAMSGVVFAATALLAIGLFGFYMIFVQTILGARG